MTSLLSRTVRTPGAVLMGLGSIIGTGLFVSVAIGTSVAGTAVLPALLLAGLLAAFNGLGSAQLASAHPVSGGTYEYGYRLLGSWGGFTAGWMFLLAKSASAATAVLGTVLYAGHITGMTLSAGYQLSGGIGLLAVLTLLVSSGMRQSDLANRLVVSFTLAGMLVFILVSVSYSGNPFPVLSSIPADFRLEGFLQATALLFVAYTGYGRIATLGEEVVRPRITIPRAVILAMIATVILYVSVTMVALHLVGSESFANSLHGDRAPLVAAAHALKSQPVQWIVSLAAVTAMLGVLLNLLLGLSRVLLAMARRGDMPRALAHIHPKSQSPAIAVWVTGGLIAVLVLQGDIVFTWSLSAFSVLVYYAITNAAALRLPEKQRLFPRWVSWAGLAGCLFLAFWIDPGVWIHALWLLCAGFIWHAAALRISAKNTPA